MKLTVYNDVSVFDELKTEWNTLVERSDANCVFSTLEWQMNWWAAYQPGDLWVVAVRTDDGQLVGIAPWFIETRADGARVVRSIGCVDVTDYVDCIVDSSCTNQVFSCLADYLAQHQDHYDRISLCNIPQASSTYQQFPQILKEHGFTVSVEQQEVCPVIVLPDDWDGYLSQLDKKQRHELRRKLRRSGAEGEIDYYRVGDAHDLEQELAVFLGLMAESAVYKAEFLQNPQHVDFFRRVMPAMYAKGWLQLNFLTVNDEPAAAYLNFDYNRHVMVYNSGLSMKHGTISPGIVLLAYLIRDAIDNQYVVFDFLRGNEEYKYRMGGKDTAVYQLKATR